ncbi:hypothetical protein FK513_28605, partial [Klebsiella pneumoniae]|nr:hypothetical protein [Klebsiella pneumoniae]
PLPQRHRVVADQVHAGRQRQLCTAGAAGGYERQLYDRSLWEIMVHHLESISKDIASRSKLSPTLPLSGLGSVWTVSTRVRSRRRINGSSHSRAKPL